MALRNLPCSKDCIARFNSIVNIKVAVDFALSCQGRKKTVVSPMTKVWALKIWIYRFTLLRIRL